MTPGRSSGSEDGGRRPGPDELREQPFAHWAHHPYGVIAGFVLFVLLLSSVGYAIWILSGIYFAGDGGTDHVLLASRVLLSIGVGLIVGSRAARSAIALGNRYTGHSE